MIKKVFILLLILSVLTVLYSNDKSSNYPVTYPDHYEYEYELPDNCGEWIPQQYPKLYVSSIEEEQICLDWTEAFGNNCFEVHWETINRDCDDPDYSYCENHTVYVESDFICIYELRPNTEYYFYVKSGDKIKEKTATTLPSSEELFWSDGIINVIEIGKTVIEIETNCSGNYYVPGNCNLYLNDQLIEENAFYHYRTYRFENLIPGTDYNIKIEASDIEGRTGSIELKTKTLPEEL